jgi:hypothetical protein
VRGLARELKEFSDCHNMEIILNNQPDELYGFYKRSNRCRKTLKNRDSYVDQRIQYFGTMLRNVGESFQNVDKITLDDVDQLYKILDNGGSIISDIIKYTCRPKEVSDEELRDSSSNTESSTKLE